jgi:N-acyl-D-aspartate/D-glutamate deacylase
MHDLVIRGGQVVDGTGSSPRLADVAIDGERITEVDGYRYTIKRGKLIYEGGKATGALPGRLVRGPQSAPEA